MANSSPRLGLPPKGGPVTQPRAADDFEVIRERLEELRREREQIENANKTDDDAPAPEGEDDASDTEAEREARRQGAPPAWVPTIFLPQPTD
jgi:hypothetical protein